MTDFELFEKFCKENKFDENPFVSKAFQSSMIKGELDLSGYSVSEKLCELIEYVILQSKTITKLKLCDCMISSKGFYYIINALMKNAFVSEVNLYGNNIQSEITKELGRLLATNCSIKILILNWNCTGNSLDSFSSFCEGLSKNESVEYLDLRNNQLSTGCAKYLSSALLFNNHLKILDLRWNKLKNEGIEHLQNSLIKNRSVVDLRLKGNFAQTKVVCHVEQHAKLNKEIETLKIEYESKNAFLLKEIKKLEEGRLRHVSKITELAHQKNVEMEKRLEEIMDKLIIKEKQLKQEGEERKRKEKDLIHEKEMKLEIMEELQTVKKANIDLKVRIKTKETEVSTLVGDVEKNLEKEIKLTNCLNKELQEKNKIISNMKDEFECLQYKLLEQHKKEIEKMKSAWIIKIEEIEEESKVKFENMKADYIKSQHTAFEEKEKEVIILQSSLQDYVHQKSLLEDHLTSSRAKNNTLELEIAELKMTLDHSLEELNSLKKELKNEKLKHKKTKEIVKKHVEKIDDFHNIIENLKTDLSNEKHKVFHLNEKLQESKNCLNYIREEEKLRSEFLSSALKKYLVPGLLSTVNGNSLI